MKKLHALIQHVKSIGVMNKQTVNNNNNITERHKRIVMMGTLVRASQ
jgi:hypothetical protein